MNDEENIQPVYNAENTRPHFFDLAVGDPGTGKTWLLLHYSRLYQEAGWQVIYLSMADDRLPANPRVLEAVDLTDAIDEAEDFQNSVLSVDELADYVPSGEALPDRRLLKIVRLRRHVRISMFATSQCPWDIHVKIRKLFNKIYFFRMAKEGQDWLRRQGVPQEQVVPPDGFYGIFDKGRTEVDYKPFTIDRKDWT